MCTCWVWHDFSNLAVKLGIFPPSSLFHIDLHLGQMHIPYPNCLGAEEFHVFRCFWMLEHVICTMRCWGVGPQCKCIHSLEVILYNVCHTATWGRSFVASRGADDHLDFRAFSISGFQTRGCSTWNSLKSPSQIFQGRPECLCSSFGPQRKVTT